MNNIASMQTVMNHHLDQYRKHHALSPEQTKACISICRCRTEALGGELMQCEQCDHEQPLYHSCRNRHCPRCQKTASDEWYQKQRRLLLPTHYYHLVFTLPHELNGWGQLHPEEIYHLLFQSAWHTLKAFGSDPKRLDGELGMSAALHTWGQNLSQHIHLHCITPGGAWNSKTQCWHPAKSNYLFPVKALSRHFRGKMVSSLRQFWKEKKLFRINHGFDNVLDKLMAVEWVVYSKPYLKKPETIINYLSRYTHKIALDDSRIIGEDNENVKFRYKDYREGSQKKTMALKAEEFIRRFLLHVLPSGFMRIRHYGYLANSCRSKKLPEIIEGVEKNMGEVNSTSNITGETHSETQRSETPCVTCPKCKEGVMHVIRTLPPK